MLTRIRARLPRFRRALRRRRRVLAALLIAVLTAMVLPSLLPAGTQARTVMVAEEDLPAGIRLAPEHLRSTRVAAAHAPPHATGSRADLLGRELVLPIPAGVPVALGLRDDEASTMPDGAALMAVPVPGMLAPRLRPGVEIEIVASGADPAASSRITAQVVEPAGGGPGPAVDLGAGSGDTVVLVAVDRVRSQELARAIREGWVMVSVIG